MASSWRHRLILTGLAAWTGLLLPTRSAADPPPPSVEELIHRLGSDDFDQRETASRELTERDWPVMPALRAATAAGNDSEVRWRAKAVLAAIRGRCPGAQAFARQVMDAAAILQDECVGQPSRAEVVERAVNALFPPDQRLMPREIAHDLREVRGMGDAELSDLLWSAAAVWERRGVFHADADLDRVMAGVVKEVDLHASWRNESNFRIGCVSNPQSVGLELRLDRATRKITVVTPIKGGPAYQAGVRAGDVLTGVTQDEGAASNDPLRRLQVKDVAGMDVEEVEERIKGRTGTEVRLWVRRAEVDGLLEFHMKRGPATPETVMGFRRAADDDWDYWLDQKRRIAYIRIALFGEDSAEDLARVLERLNAEGMQGLILDLRFNPGGLLSPAVDVSEQFLDDGLITAILPRNRPKEEVSVRPRGCRRNFALVCLVNGETVSGAEIVAACLQDHDRARMAGERTAGRCSAQNGRQVGDDRTMMMTTALFLRPSGKKIDRIAAPGRPDDEWGVIPDAGLRVDLSGEERKALRTALERRAAIFPTGHVSAEPDFEDRQLVRALAAIRKEIHPSD